MSWEHAAILVAGGAVAGFINTLAGGGSFLTVPLLVLVGLPPTVANATSRLGVFAQSLTALAGFRQERVGGLRVAVRALPATILGSWLGAYLVSDAPDALFGRVFGALMLVALPVLLLNPQPREGARRAVPEPLLQGLYLGVAIYGGAFQAGIGIPLLIALVAAGGLDLVQGNNAKVTLTAAVTGVALAQFAWAEKVVWVHGLVLALGTGVGGYAASRFGARVGPRLIRPVLTAAVVLLALRLLLG